MIPLPAAGMRIHDDFMDCRDRGKVGAMRRLLIALLVAVALVAAPAMAGSPAGGDDFCSGQVDMHCRHVVGVLGVITCEFYVGLGSAHTGLGNPCYHIPGTT